MKYLGLDLGTKTLGTAISDRMGLIANPYKTIKFKEYSEAIDTLKDIIDKENIGGLVLGLPKNMDNSCGFAANRSLEFKKLLEENFNIPIVLIDERLTTVEAERYLLNADMNRKKRKDIIDSVAASVILNTYLRMKGNNKDEK